MDKSATDYLVESFNILKANILYVLVPFLLTLGFFTSDYIIEDLRPLFVFLVTIVLFIALPLFYGQYIEIIKHGRKDTWINTFNNYWLKFILLSLILKGPVIILGLVVPKLSVLCETISFLIDIASIYILPLVFLKKEIFNSIHFGIKCLLGNFKFSLPLVFATSFSQLLPFLLGLPYKYITINFLLLPFSIGLVLLLIIIEFSVFSSFDAIWTNIFAILTVLSA